jgi:iron complex outermembrane receptor protein
VPDVNDAAGNPVPIREIPGSVVVVPRQVIDDQQDISVCGALRNVSGVFCR